MVMFDGYENNFLKFDIFVCEKKIELLTTQTVLRYLPKRDKKNTQWNTGFTVLAYIHTCVYMFSSPEIQHVLFPVEIIWFFKV